MKKVVSHASSQNSIVCHSQIRQQEWIIMIVNLNHIIYADLIVVIFGTRGAKFLPSTSALARVEEQKFRPQVANITFWHK